MYNVKNKIGDTDFNSDERIRILSYVIVEHKINDSIYNQVFANSVWSENIKKMKKFNRCPNGSWGNSTEFCYQKCVNVE
jgi:hypothetical protein